MSQWSELTRPLERLIHERDRSLKHAQTEQARADEARKEALAANEEFEVGRRALFEAFPELAGGAGIFYIPDSLLLNVAGAPAMFTAPDPPVVIPERDEARAVAQARAVVHGRNPRITCIACGNRAETDPPCTCRTHDVDPEHPVSTEAVDALLRQVQLDRERPYWSLRREQLDGVQSWLESLRDHLAARPLVREVPKGDGKAPACQAGMHDACSGTFNGGLEGSLPCACECHGRPEPELPRVCTRHDRGPDAEPRFVWLYGELPVRPRVRCELEHADQRPSGGPWRVGDRVRHDPEIVLGAIADHNCMNPDCLAEEGSRHEPDCTPERVDETCEGGC